jgi:hypothetical protein
MTAPEAPRKPTPPRPLPVEVGQVVAAALATNGSTAALERLVRGYVRALKAAEVSPEQALKRVKEVVGVSKADPAARNRRPSERLANDVVAWFLAEYYRAD